MTRKKKGKKPSRLDFVKRKTESCQTGGETVTMQTVTTLGINIKLLD